LVPEERPFQFAGTFYLPESIAAMFYSVYAVHRADTRKQGQFLAIEDGDTQREVFDVPAEEYPSPL
jgi:hypothetical protein